MPELRASLANAKRDFNRRRGERLQRKRGNNPPTRYFPRASTSLAITLNNTCETDFAGGARPPRFEQFR
jgi:hypothetical protein